MTQNERDKVKVIEALRKAELQAQKELNHYPERGSFAGLSELIEKGGEPWSKYGTIDPLDPLNFIDFEGDN